MKDPARLKNFWRSIAAESLGYAPKAKWMVTESAVEGKEDTLRKAHTSRDPMMIFNDEAEFGKNVVRVDPPGVEAALLNESNVNAQDMRDVTGIHEASLGMKSNETSGKAIMARQREGDVANLTFHDNGNAAVLEAGDVLNQFMPQIYDGTRVMRTIGEDESIKFVRLNDPYNPDSIDLSVGMYDVALSTGTSYTTRRVEAAAAMMEAIQVWPNLMGIAGDLVAKAQDWPGADKLAERLKKTIPPQYLEEDEEGGGIGVTPEQLQEMQQQLQQLSTENQVLKMEQHNKERELDIKEYLAKAQMVRALSDHEVDQNKMEQDAIQMILDGSAKVDDLEIRQQQADNQRVLADATAKQKSTPTATSTSGSKTKSQ
jgi:regulator of replication initiation timing